MPAAEFQSIAVFTSLLPEHPVFDALTFIEILRFFVCRPLAIDFEAYPAKKRRKIEGYHA